MTKKLKVIALVTSLFIISTVFYCGFTDYIRPWMETKDSTFDNNISDTSKTLAQTDSETFSEDTQPDTKDAATAGGPLVLENVQLPVECIYQNPELPTGCEITSLATVLNYLGYKVDKEYLAEKYLPMLDDFDGSFENYFIGSPWDENSWGCFAPAIVKAANKYLTETGSSKKAYNISGSNTDQLFAEVQNGNPVIVWITTDLDRKTTYLYIDLNNGRTFKWPEYEHCVVLTGYDKSSASTVTLSDPLEGIVERPYSKFFARYKELSRRAVVIK